MNYLLFTDPHLVDNPIDEYRWGMFNELTRIALQFKVSKIFCLGDLSDRKDRHSAVLVNRLVSTFSKLRSETGSEVKIISGNHEQPVTGPYFWEFLTKTGIEYITKPKSEDGIYFFPFSKNPVEDWKDFSFISRVKAALMHQTGQGVRVEGDRLLAANNLPDFNGVPVFSGDVHRPQEVEGIFYIGTPYPIKFSETWDNRVVVIQNDDFTRPISVWLHSIKRAIIDITSSKELNKLPYKKGDQIKIRYTLSGKQLSSWHEEEETIKKWASNKEIFLASLEPKFTGDGVQASTNVEKLAFELMSPDEVIKKFAADEKLSEDILEVGKTLLRLCS